MTARTGIDAPQWDRALKTLPAESQDCYFSSGYHRLHELEGGGTPFFSAAEDASGQLLVAGLRSPIPGGSGLADLESCNGYAGPLATPGASPEFLAEAWRRWQDACRENGIVAAFFRLHPLLQNENLLPAGSEIRFDRRTVFADLERGLEELWRTATPQHRNMVNRARREGAAVRWNETADWADFARLYDAAMDRIAAPARLRFSAAYFDALRALEGVELATVGKSGALDAAAVFLQGHRWAHYHLAARSVDSPNYAMNLLLQDAFERFAAAGKRGVHLGGGKTAAPDDSLLRFKMSIGGNLLDFKVALVIADNEAYDRLCGEWSRRAGTRPAWLLGYRQPLPNQVTPPDHAE